jgi:hypothetical protein
MDDREDELLRHLRMGARRSGGRRRYSTSSTCSDAARIAAFQAAEAIKVQGPSFVKGLSHSMIAGGFWLVSEQSLLLALKVFYPDVSLSSASLSSASLSSMGGLIGPAGPLVSFWVEVFVDVGALFAPEFESCCCPLSLNEGQH